MPLLDVALGFSLTMLLVASAVTALVRGLQGLRGVRAEQLQDMLQQFIEEEVKPVVARHLHQYSDKVDDTAEQVIRDAAEKLTPGQCANSKDIGKVIAVSRQDVMENIRRSELGAELQSHLGADSEVVFNDVAVRFDAIGKRYTESFRANARWWTMGTAVALALLLNIDSVFILDSYLTDPDLRQMVIAQADAVKAASQSAGNPTQRTESGGSSRIAADAGTADDRSRDAAGQPPGGAIDAVDSLKTQVNLIRSAAFPIGWNHFPLSSIDWLDGSTQGRMSDSLEWEQRNTAKGWVSWVTGILLTGFLAGLGAPFWYDAVAGLGRAIGRATVTDEGHPAT